MQNPDHSDVYLQKKTMIQEDDDDAEDEHTKRYRVPLR